MTRQDEHDAEMATMLAKQVERLKQELVLVKMNASSTTAALRQELAFERRKSNKATDEVPLNAESVSQSQPTDVCSSLLGHPMTSPLHLWNSNVGLILNATRYQNDPKHLLDDFTAQVLQIILPRLPKSTSTLPCTQWKEVERVMKVLQARLRHLHHKGPPAPRVRITVMGGSLVVGAQCRSILREIGISLSMSNKQCSWPMRLESFLNNILGGDVVQVTKVAMGGTNTETANLILQYGLLPDRHAHVLIHAYSTNDMYYYTLKSAQQSNITLRKKTFDLVQTFVRLVLQKRKCDNATRPLLIHANDYLGNEQKEIWKTTEYSQGIQVLANYYGFASLSYPNAVRDLVYSDTRERWFSPPGWYKGTSFEKEIHPNMGMHLSMAWMVAYNLHNMASTYCSMTEQQRQQATSRRATSDISYQPSSVQHDGFPPLINQHKVPEPRPRQPYQSLPPLLTQDLSLEHVSELWKDDRTRRRNA